MNIPLSKPYWGREEEYHVLNALRNGLGTGDGPYTQKLITQLKTRLQVKHVLPVTSCTHGMEMALFALRIKEGDEVIVPSFTMSSTANAVLINGATPVFADIEDVTYGIDPMDVEKRISKKTKGIMVVHYAGMPCRIEEILRIAKEYKLFVVEDAAHCIGATYKKKSLGTFGDVGVFSFHGTKNVCCGEGGVVVTNRSDLVNVMDIYRGNGTNRKQFLRGEVDKYTWVGVGTSFFLSDILAAILTAQVPKIDRINRKRCFIADAYTKALSPFQNVITLPIVPKGADPNWHIYAIRFTKKSLADVFISQMKKKGVAVSTHYVPLHSAPMGKRLTGKRNKALPVTERVADTLVRLPIYPDLKKNELQYIIQKACHMLARMR